MKKVVFLLLAMSAIFSACQKNVKVPLSYTVQTLNNQPIGDIYVPDQGVTTLSLLVKYMGGYQEDKVTITLTDVPEALHLGKSAYTEVPTYRADFTMTTSNAPHGTYPVTVTATAPGSETQTYHLNMVVGYADCAAGLAGTYNGNNACTGRGFTYTATVSSPTSNQLDVVNLGGYGSATVTHIYLNCQNDSVTIPSQNIGNGTVLEGNGTFSGNTLNIYYSASSTPTGSPETCTATLVKQ